MSRGRELAKLVVGQSVVVTGVDSDLANTIAAIKGRLDSDDTKLQALDTALAAEISSTNTDISAIRARLDSEHENTRSIIAAGLVNLADSDLIVSQLTAKVSAAITNLDSDSIALQNVQTQIDTLKGRLDSDDTKLQALDTAVTAAQARADAAHVRLDSDEAIIQGLRNTFTFFEYTATAGQTSFSGSDNNSASLIYTVNQIMVFLNGIRLESSDYTASNGTSVVLTEAAGVSNDVTIVSLVKSS